MHDSIVIKLASLAVHVEEMLDEMNGDMPDSNAIDIDEGAIRGILDDPEVGSCLNALREDGLLPLRRDA